ncbi:MAG: heme exporter protein CcmD [Devosia sp.]
MIDLGPHATYILWAYAGAGLTTLAITAWVIAGARRVRSRLAALDAAGIRRRSDKAA